MNKTVSRVLWIVAGVLLSWRVVRVCSIPALP